MAGLFTSGLMREDRCQDYCYDNPTKNYVREIAVAGFRSGSMLMLPAEQALCVKTVLAQLDGSPATITCVDRDPFVLDRARAEIRRLKHAASVLYCPSELHTLALRPNSLDYAYLDLCSAINENVAGWLRTSFSPALVCGGTLSLTVCRNPRTRTHVGCVEKLLRETESGTQLVSYCASQLDGCRHVAKFGANQDKRKRVAVEEHDKAAAITQLAMMNLTLSREMKLLNVIFYPGQGPKRREGTTGGSAMTMIKVEVGGPLPQPMIGFVRELSAKLFAGQPVIEPSVIEPPQPRPTVVPKLRPVTLTGAKYRRLNDEQQKMFFGEHELFLAFRFEDWDEFLTAWFPVSPGKKSAITKAFQAKKLEVYPGVKIRKRETADQYVFRLACHQQKGRQ